MAGESLVLKLKNALTSTKRVGREVRKTARERAKLHNQISKFQEQLVSGERSNNSEKDIYDTLKAYLGAVSELLENVSAESKDVEVLETRLTADIQKSERKEEELERAHPNYAGLKKARSIINSTHELARERLRDLQNLSHRVRTDRILLASMLSKWTKGEQSLSRGVSREQRRESKTASEIIKSLSELERAFADTKHPEKADNAVKEVIKQAKIFKEEITHLFDYYYYLIAFIAAEHHRLSRDLNIAENELHKLASMDFSKDYLGELMSKLNSIRSAKEGQTMADYRIQKNARRAA